MGDGYSMAPRSAIPNPTTKGGVTAKVEDIHRTWGLF